MDRPASTEPTGGSATPPCLPRLKKLVKFALAADTRLSPAAKAFTPAPRAKTSLGSDVNNSTFTIPKVKFPLGDNGPAAYMCDQGPAEEEEYDMEEHTLPT